ncbi:MAG: hypothetical protein ABI977_28630 [Acidobacteriota bacterium]
MSILAIIIVIASFIGATGQKPARKPAPARKAIPQFSAVLRSNADRKKLDEFLSNHEREVVSIDIFLSEKDLKDVRDTAEKRLYVDLTYKDKDGGTTGSEWLIDLEGGEGDLVLNEKTGRLQAYVKVVTITGPHMGIMSIYSKPVPIEKAQR